MTNVQFRRMPNNLYRYSTLGEVEHHSLLLNSGLVTVTSFQKLQKTKRGKSNLIMKKPDKHYFSQLIKVNINSQVLSTKVSPHVYPFLCFSLLDKYKKYFPEFFPFCFPFHSSLSHLQYNHFYSSFFKKKKSYSLILHNLWSTIFPH